MKRIRFSIASLLVLVLFCAVAFAALRGADEAWDVGMFNVTVGVLLLSVLLSVHRSGRRRAYWLGFAIFGGVYLGASLVPSIEAHLATTKALAYLDSKMTRPRTDEAALWLGVRASWKVRAVAVEALARDVTDSPHVGTGPSKVPVLSEIPGLGRLFVADPVGTTEHFVGVGHSLSALVLAFLGGGLSRLLARGGRRRDETDADRAESASS
jgi:hypothetical protein